MWRVFKLGRELRHGYRCSPLVSNSRSLLINMGILGKASSSEQCAISSMVSNSTASQPLSVPGQQNRILIDHVIYKRKGALSMQPIAPEFSPLKDGRITISREGAILLKFAPALGQFQYDWQKKQDFRLSATEIGSLLSLSPNESCEFLYDPFMGTSNAGQLTKALQITPIPDKPGYLFELSVSNKSKNFDSQLTISVTKAEFAVMRTAFNFLLPYIVGWHASVNFIKHDQSSDSMSQTDKKKSSVTDSIKPDQATSITLGKSKMQTSSTKSSVTDSIEPDQATSITLGKSKMQTSSTKKSSTSDQVTNSIKPDQATSITLGKSKTRTNSTKKSSTSDQATSTAVGKSQIQVTSVENSLNSDESASSTLGKSDFQVRSDSEWSK